MRIEVDAFLTETLDMKCGNLVEVEGEGSFSDFRFVYYRAKEFNERVLRIQRLGFYYVETLVIFSKSLEKVERQQGVFRGERARSWWKDAAERWDVFSDFRFLRDPNLRGNGWKVYSRWIENDFRGRADEVFVVEEEGRLAGFLTAFFRNGTGVVDLIAVFPEFRGRGVGKRLLREFERWARERGGDRVEAGTSSNAAAALAFYGKMGYSVSDMCPTFHWIRV